MDRGSGTHDEMTVSTTVGVSLKRQILWLFSHFRSVFNRVSSHTLVYSFVV